MSLYPNDGAPRSNMAPAPSMSHMLDHDSSMGNMLEGLEVDMLPMDLDLSMDVNDSGPQSFMPMTSQRTDEREEPVAHNGYLGQENGNNNNTSGAGAGPLPTGFGAPPIVGNGSTLTEFTKRRNWSQRIIEEIKDFLHIVTPDGRILWVSPSCRSLTGYDAQMLVGKFISDYVHPDDSGIFMREFNESIASGNALRFFYRFRKEDGTFTIFECDGHPHISGETSSFGSANPFLPSSIGLCRGFFMMARPYPTKNAQLLDSFLEHKIENERLVRRIKELKWEEVEENKATEAYWRGKDREQGISTATPPGNGASEAVPAFTVNYEGMPPPSKPCLYNTALTQQNLSSALSAQRPDSITDKMARYEGSTHLETIEMLTGLRYRDGERSHGISTGDTSPALIRGDAGIAIPMGVDRDGHKEKKNKKLKQADEYVCQDCGTLDSPEWRKGPRGPKTLCNACGLRWAKKEKKTKVPTPSPGQGQLAGMAGVPNESSRESS
ncbi:white collar 2 type of transcription factor [Elasticomyces elasticus]|nr:white collar 2 type of transcription factor [Elasticomyces elasticus]